MRACSIYVSLYSSKEIKPGTFVIPSKRQAQDYKGDSQVYSKQVNLKSVAWIHTDEGIYCGTALSPEYKSV